MTGTKNYPAALRLFHGMHHLGLDGAGLEIERSANFKRAYIQTISEDLGFLNAPTEIRSEPKKKTASARLEHHTAFLSRFNASGHPPDEEVQRFIDAEIAHRSPLVQQARAKIETGVVVRQCCLWTKGGWVSCFAFLLQRDDRPWTSESVIARYESDHGAIKDKAAREALRSIEVLVQLEWDIAFHEAQEAGGS
jgi:hypothetical protein